MTLKPLSDMIAQGKGDVPADLVLKGGKVLDVVTGALLEGDVGPRGVTTAICDPHEIANVIGVPGIEYFLSCATETVMDIRVNLSSCVPSSHMETAGARIEADDLAPLMDHPQVIGLAEFMNYPGVIFQDPGCMAKLELFRGQHIDGHCPQLLGKGLNAYVAAGIRTEHEATTAKEAREKLQKGMRVLIREGSVSKDMVALQPLLSDITSAYMCLCTDDRNPLDIGEHGHLDFMIRELIRMGCPPLAVYRAASLSAAEAFGLKDRGSISPGKRADIVVIDDLATCRAEMVFSGGVQFNDAAFAARSITPPVGRNSVKAPVVTAESFRTSANREETDVIGIMEGKIITEHLKEVIAIEDGDKKPDPERDLVKIAVVERHGINGNIASGFVKGFGLKRGAIASTVCHDHHNIACVGVDYDDMALAANRLGEIEGGFVVVENGKVLAELALPVAGLMSTEPFEVVHDALIVLRAAAKSLDVALEEPFLQLAFLALPVIPALKITDRGMVDVVKFEIIS